MINEEDHLLIQALRPGLQLKQAWHAIDQIDSKLEKKLSYAFTGDLGYLTACPTNIGTGIRVSAMLHLPGLVLAEQINPIIQSVNKLGRSEEHTSELQSLRHLVCRLLLEKKKKKNDVYIRII